MIRHAHVEKRHIASAIRVPRAVNVRVMTAPNEPSSPLTPISSQMRDESTTAARVAAVLACGPAAALAGIRAAQLLGLIRRHGIGTIHVCVADLSKRSPGGILVHRPRSLRPRDLTKRRGIPVTTAMRTLFDLASTLNTKELREAFDRAQYLELLDRPRLITLLEGASGRRRLGELRALLTAETIPLSRTRSRLERLILSICRGNGLPIPGVNVPLLGYEVDFHWPEARFVVEADGGHTSAPAVTATTGAMSFWPGPASSYAAIPTRRYGTSGRSPRRSSRSSSSGSPQRADPAFVPDPGRDRLQRPGA